DALTEGAGGSWACGRGQFDLLLGTFHHLDMHADALAEHGRALVASERAALEELAASLDPAASWQQQIDRIKDWHPPPADFLTTYDAAMDRGLEHTRNRDLVRIPDGSICVMDWVPEYQRESLPLGVMSPSPPSAPGLRSE